VGQEACTVTAIAAAQCFAENSQVTQVRQLPACWEHLLHCASWQTGICQ
jgi:hypothetical protein